MRSSVCENFSYLAALTAILIQYGNMVEEQTDRWTHINSIYHACECVGYVSRGRF